MKNEKAVAYIWAVGVCALIGGAIIYIFLGSVIDYLNDVVLLQYPLYGDELTSWQAVTQFIHYGIPGSMILITILWGHARSKASSYQEA